MSRAETSISMTDPSPSATTNAIEPAAGTGAAGAAAPRLRREILVRLRTLGPTSPDALARDLGASRTGVLQQLRALETSGVVSRQTLRHGVGRPRHLYDVTPDAQELFPANYDGLAVGLLAAIGSIGGDELVGQVFDARRRQMAGRMRDRLAERLPPAASLVERVRELAVIQDELGYLAEVDVGADGVIRLRERNCAISKVADEQAGACRAELDLFREVLGADVSREHHIRAGDRCCCYRIVERAD